MKKSLKKGFTLVELVIVIAVIAILSAVLIPTFGNVIQNSKDTAAYQNASNAVNGYIVNQAENENAAQLGEGYILVLNSAYEYKKADATHKFNVDKNTYVFQYDGNAVVKIGGKFVKGADSKTVTVTGFDVDLDKKTWTSNEDVTAIPLNYKFTESGVSASVWWVKTNPVA